MPTLTLEINCRRGCRSKRWHLTAYLMLHYLVKFKCLTVLQIMENCHLE